MTREGMSKTNVCDHNRGCWSWRTNAGLTVKCKRCGMIQHHRWKSTSGYREFGPGMAVTVEGKTIVEVIDVTTSRSGQWVAVDDWHFFRR